MTPWNHTAVTAKLGIRYPIVQGPFGSGISSPQLAAAVSNEGGLGSYGAHILPPAEIAATIAELRRLTAQPFAMNLWVPLPEETRLSLSPAEFAAHRDRLHPLREALGIAPPEPPATYAPQLFDQQLAALIEAAPPVASFVFGVPPADAVREMKRRGIVTVGAATTVDEARIIEAAGLDFVVASGSDAGGHRPSFLRGAAESLTGTLALVPQVVDAVRIPVIAAGGIGDGRGIRAALALGAAAAQLGTVFLACHESNASEVHKAALVTPQAQWTALTTAFTGRLARGIRNARLEQLERITPNPPPYPIQAWFVGPITRASAARGNADGQSLWCGQASRFARRQPAAATFRSLVEAVSEAAG